MAQPPSGRAWRVTANRQDPVTVERLPRSLPAWFGIEAAIVDYVESAHHLRTYLAWPSPAGADAGRAQDRAVGVLLAKRHFPSSAEIHLMAVERAWHRHGAGRALVAALEADLVADGAELLQVKTLGLTHPDPAYGQTRRFYEALGFLPLEELQELWPGNPCLLMVKPLRPLLA
jgi:GNAT superfamily N-acetyltransferase